MVKHVSGTCRYNYCISGYCGMLSEWDEEASETTSNPNELQFSHPVKFSTQCILQTLSLKQCRTIFDTIEKKVEKLKAKREHLRVAIRKLIELRNASSGKRPWLVSFRPHDYMNVGDEMVAYIGQWGDDNKITKTANGDWVDAMGIFGYRHHDGCMSIMAMHPIHSNTDYLEGRGSGAGVGHPSIMHRWEFDFLSNVMQSFSFIEQSKERLFGREGVSEEVRFIDIWFENIKDNGLNNFDVSLFGKALIKPQFVQAPQKQVSEKIRKISSKEDAASVLSMLSADLVRTEKEIRAWANMQLNYVHPDKLINPSEEALKYANEQVRLVCEARDFLISQL